MDVQVPVNTQATVYVPASNVAAVQENGIALTTVKDIKVVGTEAGYVKLQLGSGTYHFTTTEAAATAANRNLDEYVGNYRVTGGMISNIKVKLENNRLQVEVRNNSGPIDPIKNKKDVFQSADGSTVTFMRNEKGDVTRVVMKALGISFEGTKQ